MIGKKHSKIPCINKPKKRFRILLSQPVSLLIIFAKKQVHHSFWLNQVTFEPRLYKPDRLHACFFSYFFLLSHHCQMDSQTIFQQFTTMHSSAYCFPAEIDHECPWIFMIIHGLNGAFSMIIHE